MRIAIAISLIGCGCTKIETKKVDKLDFPHFTAPAPVGWSEIIDARVLKNSLANSHTVKPDVMPTGFPPSIYLQELTLEPIDHEAVAHANADYCRDLILMPTAQQMKVTPGDARTIDLGAFKGCDVEMTAPTTDQSARYIAVSTGTVAFGLSCNRDKRGAPAIDAVCLALAKTIVAK